MVYLLVLCMFTLFIISYKLFKDLFHPCVIFCACYTFSTFLALLNNRNWNMKLHVETLVILISGAIIFILSSLWVKKIDFNVKKHGKWYKTDIKSIDSIHIWIICFVQIIYIVRGYIYVNGFGMDNVTQMIYKARVTSVSNINSGNVVWNLVGRISTYTAYIYAYFIINTVMHSGKRLRHKCRYFAPIILWALGNIFYGGRQIYLNYLFALLVMSALYRKKNYKKECASVSQIIRYGIIAIISMIVFYYLAFLVGRGSERSVFEYISSYAGGAIQLFDLYMQNPIKQNVLQGGETFYYLYKTLYKIGLMDSENIGNFYLEFRISGELMGNVYTAYRRWHSDFGILGCLLLQTIFSCFFSLFYKIVSNVKVSGFVVILYVRMIKGVFLHFLEETFFIEICNPAFYINLIIFYLCYVIIQKVKLISRKRLYRR